MGFILSLGGQAFGNLRNRSNAGPWYLNCNNRAGNANWNIGSRQSGALVFYRKYKPRLNVSEITNRSRVSSNV